MDFVESLKTDYPPTEDELVDFVRNYYARVPARCKKHVLDELRKVYGHFEFGMFGFGTFVEWSRRHGLCTRDPVDFRARGTLLRWRPITTVSQLGLFDCFTSSKEAAA